MAKHLTPRAHGRRTASGHRVSPARAPHTPLSRSLRTRRPAPTLVERTTSTITWVKLLAETASAVVALLVALAALLGYHLGA